MGAAGPTLNTFARFRFFVSIYVQALATGETRKLLDLKRNVLAQLNYLADGLASGDFNFGSSTF